MTKYSRELKCLIAKQYSISSRQIRYQTQVFAIHGTGIFYQLNKANSIKLNADE